MNRALDGMFRFANALMPISASTEDRFGSIADRLLVETELPLIYEESCAEIFAAIESIRKADRFRALAYSTFVAGLELTPLLPRTQARVYKLHALLALNLRLSHKAYAYSHKAIEAFRNDHNIKELGTEIAEAHSQAGTAARNLHQSAAALGDFLAAYRIAVQNNAPLLAAWQLFRLGKMYLNYLEQPSRGFKFFMEAKALFATVESNAGIRGRAACLDELGDIYRHNIGNIDKAKDYYHEAKRLNEELSNTAGMSRNLSHLGLCAEAEGNLESAHSLFVDAIELLRQLPGESRGVGIRLGQEARILIALRQIPLAEKRLQEATDISLAFGDHKAQAQHELIWADLRRLQGQSSASLNHLHRATALASQYRLPTLQAASLEAQAVVARDDFADYHAARELLLASASVKLSAWEDIRVSNPSLEEVEDKGSIADMYRSLFERLLEDYRSTLSRTTDAAALAFDVALNERDKRYSSALGLFRFGAYTASIGHDLKNLVQTVNSLLAGVLAKEKVSSNARLTIDRARRALSDGVSSLGTASMLQGIGLSQEISELDDIEPTLLLLCKTYVDKARIAGITFTQTGLSSVVGKKGNKILLQVSLTTLLENSLEALKDRGNGTVALDLGLEAVSETKRFLKCQVSDNGDGIDERSRSRIFDLGFSTKEGHSGFGLPTMFFLLDTIGGSVRCESEKGSGTRFTILFPVS